MPDVIYMEPLDKNKGVIYMTPEKWKYDVILMTPISPVEVSPWELIGVYTFLGNQASTDWVWNAVGNWSGKAQSIVTTASRVRIVPRNGWWYQGETSKYRGVLDIKSSIDASPVGNDWNGVNYGFSTYPEAEAYWRTTSGEIDVGTDGIVAWGAYDSTGGADNTGGLTFYLYGQFA